MVEHLALVVAAVAMKPGGVWEQISYGYLEGSGEYALASSSVDIPAGSGIDTRWRYVVGAQDGSPVTWASKLTPLTPLNASISASWSHGYIVVLPWTQVDLVLDWDVCESAFQEFEWIEAGTHTGLILRRDRFWHDTPLTVKKYEFDFEFPIP